MAGILKRKTLRGPNNIDLDKVVYEWFRQCRSEDGIPISGPMLMEKAKSYHETSFFSDNCGILELGYLKSEISLVRSWSGPGHSG
jgi:hypothetical protein